MAFYFKTFEIELDNIIYTGDIIVEGVFKDGKLYVFSVKIHADDEVIKSSELDELIENLILEIKEEDRLDDDFATELSKEENDDDCDYDGYYEGRF